MAEEWYHNCRWCRHNHNGKCTKTSEIFESPVSDELYELVENGELSEVIKEGLKLPKMSKLENLLQWYGISQKRQVEILKAIREELEDFTPTLVVEIDSSVGCFIVNAVRKSAELELKDPENFYCKYYE